MDRLESDWRCAVARWLNGAVKAEADPRTTANVDAAKASFIVAVGLSVCVTVGLCVAK